MYIFLIFFLLLILLAGYAVSVQRSLVRSDELCRNALSQIGVQQTSRWDALTTLAKLTKDYSDHEYHTLMAVIEKRQSLRPDSTAAEIDAQERLMAQLSGKLAVLAEAYPEFKANTVYMDTMKSVNDYENKVRISRMSYNDTITKYNRMVRQFPSGLFAKMMGCGQREYLEADSAKTDMPAF